MIKAVLFDLDGTLFAADTMDFVKRYLRHVSLFGVKAGIKLAPEHLGQCVMEAANRVLVDLNGETTNAQVFWREFEKLSGLPRAHYLPIFELFYRDHFDVIGTHYPSEPTVLTIIEALKRKDKRLILATSPLFPLLAVQKRVRWTGLDPADFELLADYESMHFTKPHLDYYREILDLTGLDPCECAMVGNDGLEDMCASQLGMTTFFLEPFALNAQADYVGARGGYSELLLWAQEME